MYFKLKKVTKMNTIKNINAKEFNNIVKNLKDLANNSVSITIYQNHVNIQAEAEDLFLQFHLHGDVFTNDNRIDFNINSTDLKPVNCDYFNISVNDNVLKIESEGFNYEIPVLKASDTKSLFFYEDSVYTEECTIQDTHTFLNTLKNIQKTLKFYKKTDTRPKNIHIQQTEDNVINIYAATPYILIKKVLHGDFYCNTTKSKCMTFSMQYIKNILNFIPKTWSQIKIKKYQSHIEFLNTDTMALLAIKTTETDYQMTTCKRLLSCYIRSQVEIKNKEFTKILKNFKKSKIELMSIDNTLCIKSDTMTCKTDFQTSDNEINIKINADILAIALSVIDNDFELTVGKLLHLKNQNTDIVIARVM